MKNLDSAPGMDITAGPLAMSNQQLEKRVSTLVRATDRHFAFATFLL
jgi:hypothetical protein